MKSEALTFLKEDVLHLGQMVNATVSEGQRLLQRDSQVSLSSVEQREATINQSCQEIEEKCLELLLESEGLTKREVRTLLCSTIIAAKFERLADHAHRVARVASWALEDHIEIPPELPEMAAVVHSMVRDVLLSFIDNEAEKAREILQRDNRVDLLHDTISKRLLSDLGEQDKAQAQMRAQFLFCARFLERMGDACTSIAKRVYFIATGQRLKEDISCV